MFISIHQNKLDNFINFLKESIAKKTYNKSTLEKMNSILVDIEKSSQDNGEDYEKYFDFDCKFNS